MGTGGPGAAQGVFLGKYSDGAAAIPNRTCPPPAGALLGGSTSIPHLAALAGQTLVLSTGDEIMTVPVSGGPPAVLADAQKNVIGLVVQNGTILWANAGPTSGVPANQGSIVSMPLAGGTPTVLAGQLSLLQGIAADDENVYWTIGGPRNLVQAGAAPQGAVWKLPLTGGAPTQLAGPFDYVGPVAAANGTVIFAAGTGPNVGGAGGVASDGGAPPDGVQILAVPSTGGTPTPLASTDRAVTAIVADAATAYWLDAESLGVNHTNGDGRVRRAALDGTTTDVLASGLSRPSGLTLTGTTLTWCNPSGILSVPTAGGSPTSDVAGLDLVYACAADAAHLAWVQSDTPEGWKTLVTPR